jgi:hypothetical protein
MQSTRLKIHVVCKHYETAEWRAEDELKIIANPLAALKEAADER